VKDRLSDAFAVRPWCGEGIQDILILEPISWFDKDGLDQKFAAVEKLAEGDSLIFPQQFCPCVSE